jgi:hypothetical protein
MKQKMFLPQQSKISAELRDSAVAAALFCSNAEHKATKESEKQAVNGKKILVSITNNLCHVIGD